MNLEVVGRHALLFDDDSAAAFINTGDALVEWHSLQIDRYDVRHLLSSPPPSRRRYRNSETILSDDPSIQAELDHERYVDLSLHSNSTEIQDDEKPLDNEGYRAVSFSYGNTDDIRNTSAGIDSAGIESSGYLPPFPIPGHLHQSLPPTEKLHQIMARTAIFVSKNGGQSEIILRVKQGDNPTFGFLMPDHHLHAYFRFLVEHPELLNSEYDRKAQDESKEAGVGGALSLLGSVYGNGEEEDGDGDDNAITEKNVPQDNDSVINHTISLGLKNLKSKDEPVPIISNNEKILSVKKNRSITKSKSESVRGIKRDTAEGKASSLATEPATSKTEPVILEPPPELKRVIDKIVEFIMRNGKQFEATLIEQDTEHGRFPFLLQSNRYNPYYLKVLETAQESKVNGKSSRSRKDDDKFSSLTSALCDMPTESDRKEKFKMVIGKSKKEIQEAESKGTQQECGFTVDAAAAILQAATRGNKNTYSSEAPLTEEQKLKAERLKRAKMFVAMLKSGAVPTKTGASRGSSLEPLDSSRKVNANDKEREGSLAPIDDDRLSTEQKPEMNYFGEEHKERLSKRKYRSRSDICEEDNGEDDEHHYKREYRSKSRRHGVDDDYDNAVEKEKKQHRRHRSPHSSEDEEESIDEDKDRKLSKKKHRSHYSSHEHSRKRHSSKRLSDDENGLDNEGKDQKHSSKKHRSHRSSHHSKDKHRHKHHSKEHKSRRHFKHHSSSDDEHQSYSLDKQKKTSHDERDDLEEGEIISRAPEESRGIVSGGHFSRETSVDALSSHKRALSQPSETTTEVPDDLRAKIRAMLMATRQ